MAQKTLEARQQYRRQYREKNREKINQKIKDWRKKNKKRLQEKGRQDYQKNKDKLRARGRDWYRKNKEKSKNGTLKKRYGLSLEEYKHMVFVQDNRCAICRMFPNEGKELVVDHNHKTGEVRSLLCSQCNFALGFVKEDPIILLNMIEYIQLHNGKKSYESVILSTEVKEPNGV